MTPKIGLDGRRQLRCDGAGYGIVLLISSGEFNGRDSERRDCCLLLSLYTMCGLMKYLPMPGRNLCNLTWLPTARAQTYESEN
jgi:hypothetical protein